jgi:isoleucyl-tRNA synthetase
VRAGAWSLNADGTASVGGVTLQPDEFELTARGRAGQEVSEDGDLLVALDTTVDDELAAEGLAREVAHRLQAMRKAAGYEISDRVRVAVAGDPQVVARLEPHRSWLASEVLATALELGPAAALAAPDAHEALDLDGVDLRLSVARA